MVHGTEERILKHLKLRLCRRILTLYRQATWVPIIYVFFPESKGRELEDFDRLFAGEEDAAITERMTGDESPRYLERNDSATVKAAAAHEEEGLEGLV